MRGRRAGRRTRASRARTTPRKRRRETGLGAGAAPLRGHEDQAWLPCWGRGGRFRFLCWDLVEAGCCVPLPSRCCRCRTRGGRRRTPDRLFVIGWAGPSNPSFADPKNVMGWEEIESESTNFGTPGGVVWCMHARHGTRETHTHPVAGAVGIPRPDQRWAMRAVGRKTSRTPTWTTATTCVVPLPPLRATSGAVGHHHPRRRAHRGRIHRGCSCPRLDLRWLRLTSSNSNY
jgi:hypothetical protein